MWCFITLLLVAAVSVQSHETKKICYPRVGCFDDLPPFNNTSELPASPEELDVKLKLYTPDNPTKAFYLNFSDVASLRQSHFDAKLPVKFIIHGYFSNANGNWVTRMKNEILTKEQANVIDVDWSKGASSIDYEKVVANVRLVAAEINLLLEMMVNDKGVSHETIHIIGHSLGAQMAGIIGKDFEDQFGSKIGRISALDAAELSYKGYPKDGKVDSSDAMFVDAIHTDGGPTSLTGGFGIFERVGHVDFYVNGGIKQPGCHSPFDDIFGRKRGLAQLFACNHVRSHEVYTASINNPCVFSSFPCDSYENFLKGECTTCSDDGCGVMGYGAQEAAGRGRQYLMTLDKKPFCGYHYKIDASLQSTEEIKKVKGELDVNFGDIDGSLTTGGVLKSTDAMVDETSYQGVIIVNKRVDPIQAVVAHYKPKKSHSKAAFIIDTIDVTDIENNKVQHSGSGPYFAGGKISATIQMNTPGENMIG